MALRCFSHQGGDSGVFERWLLSAKKDSTRQSYMRPSIRIISEEQLQEQSTECKVQPTKRHVRIELGLGTPGPSCHLQDYLHMQVLNTFEWTEVEN